MLKKKKIVGYFILALYLFLCLINDIYDWVKDKKKVK